MFYYHLIQKPWSAATDSKLTVFRNLYFDGNARNFYIPVDNYTKFEPSMMIVTNCSGLNTGRLKTLIENCYFYDNITSDVSIGGNTDSRIYNVLFVHNPAVFGKGDIGVTQGNQTLHMVKCYGSRHFDVEQNGPNLGYYGDSRFDYHLTECRFDQMQAGCNGAAAGTQVLRNHQLLLA